MSGWPLHRRGRRVDRELATLQDELGVYVAFTRWRSACIGAGVYTRYAGGVMGGRAEADGGAARLAAIRAQAEAAMAALGE